MKGDVLWRGKRMLCGISISYSLLLWEGQYFLSGKEEKDGNLISSFELPLPACSQRIALSFAESLTKSATSPCMMEELIEEYFD